MRTHDQRCYEDAFEQRQREYYIALALKDCTSAVDSTDENVISEILATIGNRARWILATGDLDDKIAFVDFVCSNLVNLINNYAEERAKDDVYHRGFADTKTW